jgi:hypothetical protein
MRRCPGRAARWLLAACGATLLAGAATAQTRPVVVELFTSQGCDSCPPAETLLGQLAKRPDTITLAYHVDYWDRLGWKDTFSLPEATARQRAYAAALAHGSVYTPQMVVNGVTDVVGSDRAAVAALLVRSVDDIPLRAVQADGTLIVDIGPAKSSTMAEITVVSYTRLAQTRVTRGENAGRTLDQSSIVRSIHPLGTWNGAAERLSLDLAVVPDGATDVAVLLQAPGPGAILGAVTEPLR